MEAVYARMRTLTLARTGSSTSMIVAGPNGTFHKTFGKLAMVWTPARGATLAHWVPRGTTPTLLPAFRDVPPGTGFEGELEWMRAMRISEGWSDNTYRPVQPVQRNAMEAFLYRASGSPAFTPPTRARFSDVPVGTAFRTEIEWLASTGTTTGYADGTYRPLSPVNRDAMAAFLYRRAG